MVTSAVGSGMMWPNQLFQAVLVEPPIVGMRAAAAVGLLAIRNSPSWMTDLSKPERARPD